MSRTAAAVAKESAPRRRVAVPQTQAARDDRTDLTRLLPESCPLRDPSAMASFRAAVKAGSALSLDTQAFLQRKGPAAQAEWLKALMRQSRTVFQPWSMEILLLVGVSGTARFSELEAALGASSRTLATKLKSLAAAGMLDRTVEAGPPVQVRYTLSKAGRATVAAASPLFAHLNLVAVQGR